MSGFIGFTEVELIFAYYDIALYSAIRKIDSAKVILKVLSINENSGLQEAFKQEYKLLCERSFENICKPESLVVSDEAIYLVIRTDSLVTMGEYLETYSPSLMERLHFSVNLVGLVGELHRGRIVHGAINHFQIMVDSKSHKSYLIGLGIIESMLPVTLDLEEYDDFSNTIYFLPPEKTYGTDEIESRSDFFSIGMVLYLLFTGGLPFEGPADYQKSINGMRGRLLSPQDIEPGIPESLSDIISKMVEFDSEERYQSVWGINADLEQCIDQLNSRGKIYHFPLARHDVSGSFRLSDKIYGREIDIKNMLDSFSRVSRGMRELIFICGAAGSGKTALVNNVSKSIERRGGVFVSASFSYQKSEEPHAPILSIIRQLVVKTLFVVDENKEHWKSLIYDYVGELTEIISNLIPELEEIFGSFEGELDISGVEMRNRYYCAFSRFFEFLCKNNKAIVICIEDINYADISDIKFIEMLVCNSRIKTIQFVFTQLSENGGKTELQESMCSCFKDREEKVNIIEINNLLRSDIESWVSDLFKCDQKSVRNMSAYLQNKTGGNPFYIQELLGSMSEEKLIYFDSYQGKWFWDMTEVNARKVPEDCREFISGKLSRQQKITQDALKIIVMLGRNIDKKLLESMLDVKESQVVGIIEKLVTIKFVVRDESSEEFIVANNYIVAAVSGMLPEYLKSEISYKAAELLRKSYKNDKNKLFRMLCYYRNAISLVNLEKNNDLIELILEGVQESKKLAANDRALELLLTGMELLGNNAWRDQRDKIIKFYIEAIEAANLIENHKKAHEIFETALAKTLFFKERASIYASMVVPMINRGDMKAAVKYVVDVVQDFGISEKIKPSKLSLFLSYMMMKWNARGLNIKYIESLPEMENEQHIALVKFLSRSGSAIYMVSPELFAELSFKVVSLILKKGILPEASLLFSTLSIIYCGGMGKVTKGYEIANLALKISERYPNRHFIRGRALFMYATFVKHWKDNIEEIPPLLDEAYKISLYAGDFEFASYAITDKFFIQLCITEDLRVLKTDLEQSRAEIAELQNKISINYLRQLLQTVINLTSGEKEPEKLLGEFYNEEIIMPVRAENTDPNSIFTLYYLKIFLSYTFEDYSSAIEYSAICSDYLDCVTGWYGISLYYLYDSLSRLALYNEVSENDKRKIEKRVLASLKKIRVWANEIPHNHNHKCLLIEAELHSRLGQNLQAASLFGTAADIAKSSGIKSDEALVNEVAGKHYLRQKKIKIANVYLTTAKNLYKEWGAEAKVKMIEERYNEIFE
ncbi:MAG: hypothetical protein D6B27_09020 [Gammaproteobacteria bacterium]|nr:MAG: hypothetical protein D6B27_09020 [Gammaproteobacteria bacterium]